MSSPYAMKIRRKQSLLLPDMIDDYIDKDNPTRLFDSWVDSLDLEEIGFRFTVLQGGPGRPPTILLISSNCTSREYFNGIRSSRKLETESHRNTEVMWLIHKLTTDSKTISDFRKDNIALVKSMFQKCAVHGSLRQTAK